MRMIVCEDCRKRYDYDKDEFCPRCGAFNQPVKTWGVDAKGNVIRVDGINEQNHAESFAHREVHAEKSQRRAVGLDWKGSAAAKRPSTAASRPAVQQVKRPTAGQSRSGGTSRPGQPTVGKWITIIVAVIILINMLVSILAMLIH